MMQNESRTEDEIYGPWPWTIGFAFGGLLIWVMFALATGFS